MEIEKCWKCEMLRELKDSKLRWVLLFYNVWIEKGLIGLGSILLEDQSFLSFLINDISVDCPSETKKKLHQHGVVCWNMDKEAADQLWGKFSVAISVTMNQFRRTWMTTKLVTEESLTNFPSLIRPLWQGFWDGFISVAKNHWKRCNGFCYGHNPSQNSVAISTSLIRILWRI